MIEVLQFEFMRNALIAGLLASFICCIRGTPVVVNHIVFLSGGIAHAAYGVYRADFFRLVLFGGFTWVLLDPNVEVLVGGVCKDCVKKLNQTFDAAANIYYCLIYSKALV